LLSLRERKQRAKLMGSAENRSIHLFLFPFFQFWAAALEAPGIRNAQCLC
jgi:hypothetical protein